MANNLRVFNTLAEYEAEKEALTLATPNVSLIKNPYQVKYLQNNPPIGVGIAALVDGVRQFFTYAQWDALTVKPTVIGVYVKTPDAGFIIHPTAASNQKWSNNTTVVVPGVTTTTNQAQALLDFNGKDNTDAVLAAVEAGTIEDAPAFTWVRQQVFADGSTPYLWAAGELNIFLNNADAINQCLTLVGGTTINKGSNIWSSTQYAAVSAWHWYSTLWSINYKNYSFGCRALCKI